MRWLLTEQIRKCPFCPLLPTSVIAENATCVALRDGYPVSPGHTLIVPRRHVASFFDLTADENRDMMDLVEVVRADLDDRYSPNGYNIGLNEGTAAGQTVMHVHLHVIPRHEGDVSDPRGGIRWVLPKTAPYWEDKT